jgi:hypothetical protein
LKVIKVIKLSLELKSGASPDNQVILLAQVTVLLVVVIYKDIVAPLVTYGPPVILPTVIELSVAKVKVNNEPLAGSIVIEAAEVIAFTFSIGLAKRLSRAVLTKAVVAICVVLVPAVAVGAAGVPVNVGDSNSAYEGNVSQLALVPLVVRNLPELLV